MASGDFLDPSEQHTLTGQECELITFFRTLSKGKRQIVLQALFTVLFNDHMKKRKSAKDALQE